MKVIKSDMPIRAPQTYILRKADAEPVTAPQTYILRKEKTKMTKKEKEGSNLRGVRGLDDKVYGQVAVIAREENRAIGEVMSNILEIGLQERRNQRITIDLDLNKFTPDLSKEFKEYSTLSKDEIKGAVTLAAEIAGMDDKAIIEHFDEWEKDWDERYAGRHAIMEEVAMNLRHAIAEIFDEEFRLQELGEEYAKALGNMVSSALKKIILDIRIEE
jgi:hypothetical protein